jgi:hypothetical protein
MERSHMLAQQLLPTPQVWKAIEVYLEHAYGGGAPPTAVRTRLETLRSLASPEEFFASAVFERDGQTPPSKLSLRLGNQFYPHMKLTIERTPDRQGFLFRADSHDRHCCPPPGSREHGAFCQLMESNQKVSQAIEAQWAKEGLPTFKTFLRDDLARRAKEAR